MIFQNSFGFSTFRFLNLVCIFLKLLNMGIHCFFFVIATSNFNRFSVNIRGVLILDFAREVIFFTRILTSCAKPCLILHLII